MSDYPAEGARYESAPSASRDYDDRDRERDRSPPPPRDSRGGSRGFVPPPRPAGAPVPVPTNVLGVFGLSIRTREEDLDHEFSRVGRVEKVVVVYDQRSARSRGFGFVTMGSIPDAEKAIEELNGLDLHGRRLRVDFSATTRPHEPTPGEYRGPRRDDEFRRPPPGGYGDRFAGGSGYGGGGYGGGGYDGGRGGGYSRGGGGGYGGGGYGGRYDDRRDYSSRDDRHSSSRGGDRDAYSSSDRYGSSSSRRDYRDDYRSSRDDRDRDYGRDSRDDRKRRDSRSPEPSRDRSPRRERTPARDDAKDDY